MYDYVVVRELVLLLPGNRHSTIPLGQVLGYFSEYGNTRELYQECLRKHNKYKMVYNSGHWMKPKYQRNYLEVLEQCEYWRRDRRVGARIDRNHVMAVHFNSFCVPRQITATSTKLQIPV